MKRLIALSGIVFLGVASIIISEHRKVDVPASPAALLYLVADTEQELTRMPVSFTRMSDDEEIRIGNQLSQLYASSEDRKKTPEAAVVERYLTQVGLKLASHAHRKLPYKFHYIPSPYLINAFALPGGHVYVGAGLLALMDSEDELAAVVGHEIEHIDHYHCAERVQQEEALHRIPLGDVAALPIEIFEAGYSKDQELEADREGTMLAVEAGYSASGAIRMFETFERLYKEYESKAKTPQEEVKQVALQTVEGYFRTHPQPSERIAQVQRLIASEGWTVRPERDLAVAYIFWTAKAQDELNAGKYSRAEQLADQSLRLAPDRPNALHVLARARFAQANFSGAAAAYRTILQTSSSGPNIVAAYAHALAASDRHTAAAEFRRWADSLNSDKPPEVDVSTAGLALLAGDPEPARKLEADLRQSVDGQAPAWIGELGWWHYLAGNYQKAADLLSEGLQQRPGHTQIGLRLAWAQIEIHRYGDVLQLLEGALYEQQMQPERAMARAVTQWQAQEHDDAMRYFEIALGGQSEWENRQWVKALYSPLVEHSIQEMQAERERRRLQAKSAAIR